MGTQRKPARKTAPKKSVKAGPGDGRKRLAEILADHVAEGRFIPGTLCGVTLQSVLRGQFVARRVDAPTIARVAAPFLGHPGGATSAETASTLSVTLETASMELARTFGEMLRKGQRQGELTQVNGHSLLMGLLAWAYSFEAPACFLPSEFAPLGLPVDGRRALSRRLYWLAVLDDPDMGWEWIEASAIGGPVLLEIKSRLAENKTSTDVLRVAVMDSGSALESLHRQCEKVAGDLWFKDAAFGKTVGLDGRDITNECLTAAIGKVAGQEVPEPWRLLLLLHAAISRWAEFKELPRTVKKKLLTELQRAKALKRGGSFSFTPIDREAIGEDGSVVGAVIGDYYSDGRWNGRDIPLALGELPRPLGEKSPEAAPWPGAVSIAESQESKLREVEFRELIMQLAVAGGASASQVKLLKVLMEGGSTPRTVELAEDEGCTPRNIQLLTERLRAILQKAKLPRLS